MADEKPVAPRSASKRNNTIGQDTGARPRTAAQPSPEATKKVKSIDPSVHKRRRPVTFPMLCESAISPRRANGRASPHISRRHRQRNRRSATRADGSSPPARATRLCAISLPSLAIAGGRTSMLPAVRRSEGRLGSKPVAKVWRCGDIGRANGICRSWTESAAMLVATALPLPSRRRRRANLGGIDASPMRRLDKHRPNKAGRRMRGRPRASFA